MAQDNKKWIIALAAVLIVIFTVMVMDNISATQNKTVSDNISDAIDNTGNKVENLKDDIVDEIEETDNNPRYD